FSEHDQRWTVLIEPRIHPGRDLRAAGERETNMNAISHLVCGERALDFLDDFLARRNFGERQGARRTLESVEMFVELKNSAAIQAQPLPDGVAALHCRIEWANPGFVTMH